MGAYSIRNIEHSDHNTIHHTPFLPWSSSHTGSSLIFRPKLWCTVQKVRMEGETGHIPFLVKQKYFRRNTSPAFE